MLRSCMQKPEIVDESFENGWVQNISNEDYHSDRSAVSSSALRTIEKSPKAFLAAHNALYRKETAAFSFGTVFHMALLEPELFKAQYVIMPKFSGTGSVAARKVWKASQRSDAVILTEEEYQDLQGMIDSVLSHRDAANILRHGEAEMTGLYRDPITGIKCRIRPDFLHFGHMALLDVKTTTDVRESEFQKSIMKYGYHTQLAMYKEGIELITGKDVQYTLFLVCEKSPPYECALYMPDTEMLDKGRMNYQAALTKLHECLTTNVWDPYQNRIQPISLPIWANR
jgi:hypothetical protein